MISPTVGRVVHYFHSGCGPFAAHICWVHSDTCVNLMWISDQGIPHGATSVQLLQDADKPPEHGTYCKWMEYQVTKAKDGDNNSESAEPRPR
jgi:hypothetical protein